VHQVRYLFHIMFKMHGHTNLKQLYSYKVPVSRPRNALQVQEWLAGGWCGSQSLQPLPEDGGCTFLRNVEINLSSYTV
jgi:hypothetical protein